jgi:peroxiredoxin
MVLRCKVALWGILIAAIISFIAVELFAYPVLGYPKGTRQEKAPDFALNDLQGRKFKLSDSKGKPVLLVFGATWCPYCREEIPRLKDIYAAYGKKGLVFVNIDIQESRDKVLRFADKYKLPYRTFIDEKAEVASNYDVQGVPTLVLIDRDGMILCRQCSTVEPLLDKMFKQK